MELDEYQRRAKQTFIVEERRRDYLTQGLTAEAGEVANTVKKVLRGDHRTPRERLKAELGDVLWYVAVLADELGYDLDDVATANLAKLQGRAERDTIRGDGDDR